jgi:hypothetical protein
MKVNRRIKRNSKKNLLVKFQSKKAIQKNNNPVDLPS